jgi:hypothetical protein
MEFAMARPTEPETYTGEEAARRDRFDFRPRTRNRVVVNARKQPPAAPLFVIETRNEPSAQNGPLDLQKR